MYMLLEVFSLKSTANVTKTPTAFHLSHMSRLRSGLKPVTWKRCKIVGKLVLITNRKSYMSFRLVPKSVTLKP